MTKTHSNAWLLVLLTIFFWGSNCNAIAFIVKDVPPLTGAAIRFSYALVLFLAFRAFSKAESTLSVRDILFLVSLGILGVFGYNYTFFSALHSTSALNAALIMALSPAITQLLSYLWLKQKISPYQILGIFIAFFGVALVITKGALINLHFVFGDLLMLFACLLWSLYTLTAKKIGSAIPPLQLARWTVCSGSIALIFAALIVETPLQKIPSIPFNTQLLLAYTGIMGSFLAYIFWLGGVKTLGAGKSALSLNLMPVVTLFIDLVIGIYPTPIQLIGTVTVILGILIALNWKPADLKKLFKRTNQFSG